MFSALPLASSESNKEQSTVCKKQGKSFSIGSLYLNLKMLVHKVGVCKLFTKLKSNRSISYLFCGKLEHNHASTFKRYIRVWYTT
jgi:hypothetical protein